MKKKTFWETLMDLIIGSGKQSLIETVKETVSETMDEAEEKLEGAIKKILSLVGVFLIVFLGFIFVLVGFGKYLTSLNGLGDGIGFLVLGAGIIVLALFFRIIANR